jgi:hypothetical protein
MKAKDLAAYFKKKIAQPIFHELSIGLSHQPMAVDHYAIEPIAVRDNVLHVMVIFRFLEWPDIASFSEYKDEKRPCGEAAIPLKDGDTVLDVLDMAIVGTVYGDADSMPKVRGDEQRLVRAVRSLIARDIEVEERLAEAAEDEAPKPPGR